MFTQQAVNTAWFRNETVVFGRVNDPDKPKHADASGFPYEPITM